MSSKRTKTPAINYTNREYESIREDLTQIAERFYPDTFQDFSEASFGSMMLDAVAYVGDQLSFYLDYNVNESFLDTSYQLNNITRHGRILGYKNTGRPSTYGEVALYVLVPASTTGIGPDRRYIPIVKRGTRFTSQNGLNFVLTEDVDFLTRITKLLDSKECTNNQLYFDAATSLHELSPSALSASKMGKLNIAKKNYITAVNYFKQAVELEEDAPAADAGPHAQDMR